MWDLAWPVPTARRDRHRDACGSPGWPTAGELSEGAGRWGQVAGGGPVAGWVVAGEGPLPAEAEVASPVPVPVDEQLVGVDESGAGLGVEAGKSGGRRRPLPLELGDPGEPCRAPPLQPRDAPAVVGDLADPLRPRPRPRRRPHRPGRSARRAPRPALRPHRRRPGDPPTHLRAALALWDYAARSAAWALAAANAGPTAARIADALAAAGSAGLTRTQIRDALGRNAPGADIDTALAALVAADRAQVHLDATTGGRPARTWTATPLPAPS